MTSKRSTLPAFSQPAFYSDVFEQIRALDAMSGLSATERKHAGVIYTPPYVALAMIRMARLQPTDRILEPAVGRGTFVFSLIAHWLEEGWSHAQVARWAEKRLFASDVDRYALDHLASLWRDYFAKNGVVSDLRANLRVGDALFAGWSKERFAVTITNPPYVRCQNLEGDYRERLQATFTSLARGNGDLYFGFIERAIAQSDRVVMLVPNTWMRTVAGKGLRELLKPRVRCVVDFGERRVFPDASVFASILVTGAETAAPLLHRSNLPEEGDAWSIAFRQSPALAGSGWSFGPPVSVDHPDGETLGNVADVFCGLNTCADRAFLVENGVVKNGVVHAHEPVQGLPVRLPLRLAPRFLKLTKVKSKADAVNAPRALCPYDQDWTVTPEEQLGADVQSWFKARETTLRARDNGKVAGYEAWYAYGRRQGLRSFALDRPVLLIPAMASGPLRPVEVTPRELGGRFVWVSGFVVQAKNKQDHERLKAMLGSEATWRSIERQGGVYAGGYRSIGANLLRSIMVEPVNDVAMV